MSLAAINLFVNIFHDTVYVNITWLHEISTTSLHWRKSNQTGVYERRITLLSFDFLICIMSHWVQPTGEL